MNFKKILLIACSASIGFALTSCGSGAGSPTNNQNYGEVVGVSKQQLGEIPAELAEKRSGGAITESLPYSKFAALGLITLAAGTYINLGATGFPDLFIQPNDDATAANYNYEPEEALLLGSLDPEEDIAIAESVSAYAVEYKTPGQNAETDPNQIVRTVSGLIVVPNMKTGEKIKGVVIYFHPTTAGKNQVPSCLGKPDNKELPIPVSDNIPEYCNLTSLDNTGAATFATLAFIYAANGYIVVAPDYVGQGSDWNNVHPYVAYPDVNVKSALNMLPATRSILAQDYAIGESQVLPLFVTGYSEGGAYALKASQMIQADSQFQSKYGLTLKMTSPQEGAYSLQDQVDFAFNEVYDGVFNCPSESCGQINVTAESGYLHNLNNWNIGSGYYAAQAKPYLTSYVLTSVNYYSFNNLTSIYDFTMNKKFWSQVPIDGKIANLYQLYSSQPGYVFSGNNIIESIVLNTIGINNYDYPSKPKINLFISDSESIPLTLAQSTANGVPFGQNNNGDNFLNPGIQTNPEFKRILSDATTYNWQTQSPINFIYMRNDSAVTVLNSKQAISCMQTGKNFSGDSMLAQSSAGNCTTPPSGSYLIGETIIPNYQITNNLAEMIPGNESAVSQFNVNPQLASNPAGYTYVQTMNAIESKIKTGTPFDHGDMFVLGNIIALCNFENMLESNTISSRCPDKYNPFGS